jgi:hypothetical protein
LGDAKWREKYSIMEQFTSSCDNGPSAIKTLTMPSFWEEEDIFVVECVMYVRARSC